MTTFPCRAEHARRSHDAARWMLVAAVVIVSAVAHASAALAQAPAPVDVGSRVRVTAPSLDLMEAVGTVQQVSADGVLVQFEAPRRLVTLDRSTVTSMEVSVGQRRAIGKGIGVGLLVGAGSGALIGLASGDDDPGLIAFSAEEKALALGLGLGLIGGVVGLIAGAAHRSDVWAPARTQEAGIAIRPRVSSDGVGLLVRFSLPLGGGAG